MRVITLLILVLALSGCGTRAPYEGKSALELEGMLTDPNPAVQAQGAHGLSLLAAEAKPAVPALIQVLSKGEPVAQEQAALALGKIGPEARAAVPALTEALKSRA